MVIWVSYPTETVTVGLTGRWCARAALGAERCLAASFVLRGSSGMRAVGWFWRNHCPPQGWASTTALAYGLREGRDYCKVAEDRQYVSDIWDGFCVWNKTPGLTLMTHLCE